MVKVPVTEIKKGDTALTLSGVKFKVGEVTKESGGRIGLYNTRGKQMMICGKAVQVNLVVL